jgi:hypothetical protein
LSRCDRCRQLVTWLILVYKVPAVPSRLRAVVWRRLTALRAVYLQHGVAALPNSATAERALRTLCREIGVVGGVGQLLYCHALAGQGEVATIYNRARQDEYRDFVGHCQDFAGQVERLIAEGCHSYNELKKHDESLIKLKGVLALIHDRDVLGAAGRDDVTSAIVRCEETLQAWSAFTYHGEPS